MGTKNSDTFHVFKGNELIKKFDILEDTISINLDTPYSLHSGKNQNSTIIKFEGGEKLRVKGVTKTDLLGSGAIVLGDTLPPCPQKFKPIHLTNLPDPDHSGVNKCATESSSINCGVKDFNISSFIEDHRCWKSPLTIISKLTTKDGIEIDRGKEIYDYPELATHQIGGDGDDVLDGALAMDTLEGGEGNDKIHGGSNHDTIKGGAGHDLLIGHDGDDLLYGNSGDDDIETGSGKDFAFGGRGKDKITMSYDESFDRIYASNKNLAEKEYDLIIDFDPDYDAEIIFPGSMGYKYGIIKKGTHQGKQYIQKSFYPDDNEFYMDVLSKPCKVNFQDQGIMVIFDEKHKWLDIFANLKYHMVLATKKNQRPQPNCGDWAAFIGDEDAQKRAPSTYYLPNDDSGRVKYTIRQWEPSQLTNDLYFENVDLTSWG